MGAFTDLSSIVNRLSGGNSGAPEHIWFYKDGRVGAAAATTPTAGCLISLWNYNGIPGANASAPGALAIPDNLTAGGMLQTDPAGGRQKYLLGFEAECITGGVLILYDRLAHISGLNGTTITAQTVQADAGPPVATPITRYTDGVGNQIWVEIYTAIGGTARTVTANYRNTAGTPALNSTVATAIGGATNALNAAQRVIPLPLAQGDTGVKSVKDITLSASTGTAGDFGVTIVHPLAAIVLGGVAVQNMRDMVAGFPSLVEVKTDACLALAWLPNAATVPQFWGAVHMAEV
jgi:hypothetical protein